jgi:hypothetical protein
VVSDPERARAVASAARKLYETKYSRAAYEGRMRQLLSLMEN